MAYDLKLITIAFSILALYLVFEYEERSVTTTYIRFLWTRKHSTKFNSNSVVGKFDENLQAYYVRV